MTAQYVGSVQYTAVAQWAATHAYAAGSIVRQLATPGGTGFRCFKTTLGGTSGSTEPIWVLTAGSTSPTDGTITDWKEFTGSSWASPHNTLVIAISTGWANAGDDVYVANTHNVTVTVFSLALIATGTYAAPNRILSVNPAGSVPPVSADLLSGATEIVSGSAATGITSGAVYIYGVKWFGGNGNSSAVSIYFSNATPNTAVVAENCTGTLAGNFPTPRIIIGGALNASLNLGRIQLKNFTASFANVGQGFQLGETSFEWYGGVVQTTAPTTLIAGVQAPCTAHIRDVDLSLLGTGKTLVGAAASAVRIVFERCKLGASVTVAATPTSPGAFIDLIDCDSGATTYRNERYMFQGTLTTETVVVMSGGATDGTTPFSHKIQTNANNNWMFPFESFPMGEFYAGATGSAISQTFELITDGVTLTNKQAWIELEYLGSNATPKGSFATNAPLITGTLSSIDPLATGSNLTTSTATWTTTGITTPMPQKITITWTPQLIGLYRAVLKVGIASTQLWINPPATKAQ